MRSKNETVDKHFKNIASGILCHSQAHKTYKSYVLIAAYIKMNVQTYTLYKRSYCFNNTRPTAGAMVGGGRGVCEGEGEALPASAAGMQHVAFSNQLHLASDHGKCVIYDSKTCIPQLLSEWMASGCYKFYLLDRLTSQRRRWWDRVGWGGPGYVQQNVSIRMSLQSDAPHTVRAVHQIISRIMHSQSDRDKELIEQMSPQVFRWADGSTIIF